MSSKSPRTLTQALTTSTVAVGVLFLIKGFEILFRISFEQYGIVPRTQDGLKGILCSPLLRAQQTAAAVLDEIGPITLSTTEHLTSSSDPRHILRELSELNRETVLLIGHEPHLSTTISVLLAGDERSRVLMNPCSLACLRAVASPKYDKTILQWLIHPEQIQNP